MNNDQVLVRPIFRILYGIVSVIFVFGTYASLYIFTILWGNKFILFSNILTWFLICSPLIYMMFAYTACIIALRGKPPKYLAKYLSKYQK